VKIYISISLFCVTCSCFAAFHNFTLRNPRAFPITDTELKLIAAAAIMGLKRMPKNG
jgi:hypothetical protein